MKKNIFELHNVLKGISVIAVITIFIRQFVLYDVPEFFEFGYELGELLFNLSIGFLVTFWFYYLTVYRRERNYKVRSRKYVEVFVNKVVIAYDNLINDLIESKQHVINELGIDPNSEKGFAVLLKLNKMGDISPTMDRNFVQMTWADYIKNQRNQIDSNLRECSIVFQYLDPEEIEVITVLISHELLEVLKNMPIETFESIEAFSDLFFDFGKKVRNLEKTFLK